MNIQDLENLPENFMIGRDSFGWRYSKTANSGQNSNWYTGFATFTEAIEHFQRHNGRPPVSFDSNFLIFNGGDHPGGPKWTTCICGCPEKRHLGTPQAPTMNYGRCRDCDCPELKIKGTQELLQQQRAAAEKL